MASTINLIGYSLHENKLNSPSEDKNFFARVNSKGRVNEKDLVNMIVKRNSTVTKQEVTAVLDLLTEVVKSSIQMGYNVHTELFSTSLSVRGVFKSMTDEYDLDRHRVVLNVRPSKDLKTFIKSGISLEKEDTKLPSPTIFSFYDYASDSIDSIVTPGNTASIDGTNLNFDSDNEEHGLYFVNQDTMDEIKADRNVLSTPKKLVFMVPATLGNGNYSVVVKCGFGTIIRSSALQAVVNVNNQIAA